MAAESVEQGPPVRRDRRQQCIRALASHLRPLKANARRLLGCEATVAVVFPDDPYVALLRPLADDCRERAIQRLDEALSRCLEQLGDSISAKERETLAEAIASGADVDAMTAPVESSALFDSRFGGDQILQKMFAAEGRYVKELTQHWGSDAVRDSDPFWCELADSLISLAALAEDCLKACALAARAAGRDDEAAVIGERWAFVARCRLKSLGYLHRREEAIGAVLAHLADEVYEDARVVEYAYESTIGDVLGSMGRLNGGLLGELEPMLWADPRPGARHEGALWARALKAPAVLREMADSHTLSAGEIERQLSYIREVQDQATCYFGRVGQIKDVIRTLDRTVEALIRYRRDLPNGEESVWITDRLVDLWTHVTGRRRDMTQTLRGKDKEEFDTYYTMLRIYGSGWLRSREEADEIRRAVLYCYDSGRSYWKRLVAERKPPKGVDAYQVGYVCARFAGPLFSGILVEDLEERLRLGVEALRKATTSRDPGVLHANLLLGRCLARLGEWDAALAAFEKVASASPDSRLWPETRMTALLEIADVEIALARKAIDEDSLALHVNRGLDALDRAERASRDGALPGSALRRGHLHLASGDVPGAARLYAEAVGGKRRRDRVAALRILAGSPKKREFVDTLIAALSEPPRGGSRELYDDVAAALVGVEGAPAELYAAVVGSYEGAVRLGRPAKDAARSVASLLGERLVAAYFSAGPERFRVVVDAVVQILPEDAESRDDLVYLVVSLMREALTSEYVARHVMYQHRLIEGVLAEWDHLGEPGTRSVIDPLHRLLDGAVPAETLPAGYCGTDLQDAASFLPEPFPIKLTEERDCTVTCLNDGRSPVGLPAGALLELHSFLTRFANSDRGPLGPLWVCRPWAVQWRMSENGFRATIRFDAVSVRTRVSTERIASAEADTRSEFDRLAFWDARCDMRDVTADGTITLELLPKASPSWAIAAGVADTWARYSTFLAESQTKYLETRATSGTFHPQARLMFDAAIKEVADPGDIAAALTLVLDDAFASVAHWLNLSPDVPRRTLMGKLHSLVYDAEDHARAHGRTDGAVPEVPIDVVLRECDQFLELIAGDLQAGRVRGRSVAYCDAARVVDAVVASARETLPNACTISYDRPANCPVAMPEWALEMSLENALRNAVRATAIAGGGDIPVSLGSVEDDEDRSEVAGMVGITVSNAFRPDADASSGGHGVGVSVMKKLVESFDGAIEVSVSAASNMHRVALSVPKAEMPA